jgi:hypothetical protein
VWEGNPKGKGIIEIRACEMRVEQKPYFGNELAHGLYDM